MQRGGLCLPVKRQRLESGLAQGLGNPARPKSTGGNPPCGNPSYWRLDCSRPGQGRQSMVLGFSHQGTQERVLLWLVRRGGAESENATPNWSELETWPTSKPKQYFAFHSPCQEQNSLFVRSSSLLGFRQCSGTFELPGISTTRHEQLPPSASGGILLVREEQGAHLAAVTSFACSRLPQHICVSFHVVRASTTCCACQEASHGAPVSSVHALSHPYFGLWQ